MKQKRLMLWSFCGIGFFCRNTYPGSTGARSWCGEQYRETFLQAWERGQCVSHVTFFSSFSVSTTPYFASCLKKLSSGKLKFSLSLYGMTNSSSWLMARPDYQPLLGKGARAPDPREPRKSSQIHGWGAEYRFIYNLLECLIPDREFKVQSQAGLVVLCS